MPVLRGLTLKTPNPRSSMRSPRSMARFIVSKTVSTAISALVLLKPVRFTTLVTMSNLIILFVAASFWGDTVVYVEKAQVRRWASWRPGQGSAVGLAIKILLSMLEKAQVLCQEAFRAASAAGLETGQG